MSCLKRPLELNKQTTSWITWKIKPNTYLRILSIQLVHTPGRVSKSMVLIASDWRNFHMRLRFFRILDTDFCCQNCEFLHTTQRCRSIATVASVFPRCFINVFSGHENDVLCDKAFCAAWLSSSTHFARISFQIAMYSATVSSGAVSLFAR